MQALPALWWTSPLTADTSTERMSAWQTSSTTSQGRRRFSEEFKRDAVELVRTSGKPVAQIAEGVGIYDSTLGNWVLYRGNPA